MSVKQDSENCQVGFLAVLKRSPTRFRTILQEPALLEINVGKIELKAFNAKKHRSVAQTNYLDGSYRITSVSKWR
jgi:hypothetical protein